MLATRLKTARQNKHLTQQDVADKLNVSRQSISKWENGSSTPDIDTLNILSSFYEVSIQDLTIENNQLKEKIEHNKQTINHQKKQLALIKKITEKSESDESFFLLIIALLCLLIDPLGIIILPLIMIRNNRTNKLHTLVLILSLFILIYNLYALYVGIQTIFDVGNEVSVY